MFLPLLAAISIPLRNVEDSQHLVDIAVGTPPQRVQMLLDTGSNSLWVPSAYCASAGCKHRPRFNHTQSKTYRSGDVEFEVDYRSGVIVGELAYESVQVGEVSLRDTMIGVVFTEIGSAFESVPFSGILGLGFGTPDFPSLFDALVASGKLPRAVAGVVLSPFPGAPGELTLGGVNSSRVAGDVVYAPLATESFWDVEIEEFLVGETVTSLCRSLRARRGKCVAAIDTGTPVLAGPSDFVAEVRALVKVSYACVDTHALPTLAVQVNGKRFDLQPDDYVVIEDGGCGIAMMPMDVSPPRGPLFVLGGTFLRKFYTVLDREEMRVGFAPLRCVHDAKLGME